MPKCYKCGKKLNLKENNHVGVRLRGGMFGKGLITVSCEDCVKYSPYLQRLSKAVL